MLLGLVAVLALASTLMLLNQFNRGFTRSNREAESYKALLQIREALIARAVADLNRPGSLPCPDINGDGTPEQTPSDCVQFSGWLPWRTLDLPDLRDSSGERFWYVLSPTFRDFVAAQPINTLTSSTLSLDGKGPVAALVIAPGPALPGKNRPSNNIGDYLDGVNGTSGTSNFISGPQSNTFNDQIVALDSASLMYAVAPRILYTVRAAIIAAGGMLQDADTDGDGFSDAGVTSGKFPYKNPLYAPFLPVPDFLQANNWYSLISYDRVAKTLSLNGRSVSLQ